MARRILFALLCTLALTAPPIAKADGGNENSDTCSQACPEGQVTTSFLDGQAVHCVCMNPGPGMSDDSNVQYGAPGDEAPANTGDGS